MTTDSSRTPLIRGVLIVYAFTSFFGSLCPLSSAFTPLASPSRASFVPLPSISTDPNQLYQCTKLTHKLSYGLTKPLSANVIAGHCVHFRSAAKVTTTTLGMSGSDESEGMPSSPLDRPVLSLIDATSIFIFAAVGKASHSPDGSLDIAAVLLTALPFLLSWFVVAPLMGCYKPGATADIKGSVIEVGKGWILAIPLGCVIRGLIKGYVPPVPFVIVTLISTLIILSLGRVIYTALAEVYVEMF
mmetsp:Transcript_20475/g.30028  ORF Transcript_20475/g.30028 Transcript_20475/m.30028 type:complete len:244 (+) Transcript_20475:47-778(+)